MLVVAQAVSLVVTGIGALLGTFKELKHKDPLTNRERVTTAGRAAALLIAIGLFSNAVVLGLQTHDSKVSEKRAEEAQRRLVMQNQSQQTRLIQQQTTILKQSLVRRVTVSVTWNDDARVLPNGAVLTFMESPNGPYMFVIPTEVSSKRGSFRPAVVRHVNGSWRPVPGASVTFVSLGVTTISLEEKDVPDPDWPIEITGDLGEVRHSLVMPVSSGHPDAQALRRALASIQEVSVAFDSVPVHRVPKASFGPDLVLSTFEGGDFVSQGRYQQAKFYTGPPDWIAIAATGNPARVAAPNELYKFFKGLQSEGQDLTIEPSG